MFNFLILVSLLPYVILANEECNNEYLIIKDYHLFRYINNRVDSSYYFSNKLVNNGCSLVVNDLNITELENLYLNQVYEDTKKSLILAYCNNNLRNFKHIFEIPNNVNIHKIIDNECIFNMIIDENNKKRNYFTNLNINFVIYIIYTLYIIIYHIRN